MTDNASTLGQWNCKSI